MTSVRDQILARVAGAVSPEGADPMTEARLKERLLHPPKHLRPQWDDDPIERFVSKLRAVAASVDVVSTAADVAKSVGDFLRENDLPVAIVMAPDDRLSGYPWPDELEISRRKALAEDITTITAAEAGVIETGSLVLRSSAKSPTGMNFLPENHIVILRQKQLVKNLEDGWKSALESSNGVPRTVNFITGPSKTTDIEQTIEYGAHGPRRLHVILLLTL
jgi:L-lactate dehydrogenase complex protein LldG|tara:strand:+ start:1154 stop:1810 length:657 start_codon:yes stop_codon:yes gene_type:complete